MNETNDRHDENERPMDMMMEDDDHQNDAHDDQESPLERALQVALLDRVEQEGQPVVTDAEAWRRIDERRAATPTSRPVWMVALVPVAAAVLLTLLVVGVRRSEDGARLDVQPAGTTSTTAAPAPAPASTVIVTVPDDAAPGTTAASPAGPASSVAPTTTGTPTTTPMTAPTTAAPAVSPQAIRSFDLTNFTYPMSACGEPELRGPGETFALVDGLSTLVEQPGYPGMPLNTAWMPDRTPPAYGDLDGDGTEEAVVVIACGRVPSEWSQYSVLTLGIGDAGRPQVTAMRSGTGADLTYRRYVETPEGERQEIVTSIMEVVEATSVSNGRIVVTWQWGALASPIDDQGNIGKTIRQVLARQGSTLVQVGDLQVIAVEAPIEG